MSRRIAILPARGGSKRIPDKNIRNFCGKPMIAHALEAARQSGAFDRIHVSTDSARIAEVAAGLGFPPAFPRPAALADDHTPIMPVLRHTLEEYARRGETFDVAVLVMACAPLIESDDLSDAIAFFEHHDDARPVLAVTPYPAPVEWAFDRREDGSLIPVQPGMFAVRSQDLGEKYFDAGLFCVFSTQQILDSEGAGDDSGFLGYVIPRRRAVDIDDMDSLELAEALWRARNAN